MATVPVPVRIPSGTKPGAVVELYTAPDGTLAVAERIPAPRH